MKKKPMQVEEIRDVRSKRAVGVFYDFEAKDFFAALPNGVEEVRDPTQPGCATKARDMLARAREFTWKAVILVSHDCETHPGAVVETGHREAKFPLAAKVSFQFWRCEIAPRAMRKVRKGEKEVLEYVQRPHPLDLPEDEREPAEIPFGCGSTRPNAALTRERGHDICSFWERGDVLPYTDETWAALHRLRDTLLHAGKMLEKLLVDPEQLALAAAGGVPLLGADMSKAAGALDDADHEAEREVEPS